MGHHLFKVIHSTTVSIPHKELHPIKGTGIQKLQLSKPYCGSYNLPPYRCTHSCECFYETSMWKVEKMRWLWVMVISTFWVDLRDFLATQFNAQRGKPTRECPCIIGVLSTSILFWWCWDGGKDLEASHFGKSTVRGSLYKMSLPLGFLVWIEIPTKDTAEARAEREVHEAAKKTVKIRWKHKSLDWAEVSWPSDNFSGRILHVPQHLFSSHIF